MEQLTLRQIRLMREKSKKDVADMLGIHENTYARWEETPSQIAIEVCYKICDFFKVEYDPHIFLP